ncbi:MAG TPA: hypothetical protein VIW70_18590 [Rubrivivax sp.]
MFESTLPFGAPDLMRVSAFRRYLDELVVDGDAASTRLSSLSPSLMADLLRFEQGGRQTELLEVLAASTRHRCALVIHLQSDDRVLPVTIFPVEQLAHCPVPMAEFLALRLPDLVVMHVEPALLRPPGDRERLLVADPHLYVPLRPVTWELALRGARGDLLPEIPAQAAYRIPPGTNLAPLDLHGSIGAAVARMRRETTNLKDMAAWPAFDRERAMRLLNALYLQAALMATRTHPAATNDGWAG